MEESQVNEAEVTVTVEEAPAVEVTEGAQGAVAEHETVPLPEGNLLDKIREKAEAKSEPEAPEESPAEPKAAGEYTPDLTYKVDGEEFKFDEKWKDLIKNKEIEDEIRTLHARAHGLEYIKGKREAHRAEYQELKQKFENTSTALESLGGYVANNDFDSFFGALNIPTDKILKYALDVAQRTPEQSQAIMQQRQAAHAATDYERQRTALAQSQQEFAVQQRTFELEQQLSKPDVAGFSQMFDAKIGRSGAFKEEVIKRGQLYAARGEDIPAEKAIEEVVSLLRPVYGDVQASTQSPKVVAPAATKPTILNIPTSGSSAVKRSPKSLADLYKLGELASRGAL